MSATAFQRRRRELEAQRKEQNEPSQKIIVEEKKEQNKRINSDQIEEMTKAQIIKALEELNVEFNNRDNKETLKGLLLNVNK